MHTRNLRSFIALLLCTLIAASARADDDANWTPLFSEEGVPEGWVVTPWNDLAAEAPAGSEWRVEDGILQPGVERGTWLISEREYENFILEFEILLTELGNSGVALRAPMFGDPAFDGMEMQMADFRYNMEARDHELTAAIYRAIAPTEQVYQPTEWNHFIIELNGSHLKVTLNDVVVQDVDLTDYDQPTLRHDGTEAPPLKDRPTSGHIGFQHLSRENEPVQIRNVRIREFP
jgi:hypothetical protein